MGGDGPAPAGIRPFDDARAHPVADRPGPSNRPLSDDFRDILREFVAADVRFLVVGAHALAVHGVPRATGDLDLWVESSDANAERIITALTRFGAPVEALGIRREDFLKPDLVAQLGLPPFRVDLLTSLSGVDFATAWRNRLGAEVEGVRVPVIDRVAFVVNKRATGRGKDLADIESLSADGEPPDARLP